MKTLRDKAEILLGIGIEKLYFKILLKQKKITEKDKKHIERLWEIIENEI